MLLLMHSKHPFPLFLRVTNANPKNKLGGGEEGGFLGRETNVILKKKISFFFFYGLVCDENQKSKNL